MKTLFSELKTSVLATLVLGIVLCGFYPAVVWAGGQLMFHDKANGSLVVDADGTIRGSSLLAQSFTGEKYFHPRPSAAGSGYDATASSGTNLGPTSQKLADAIKAAVAAYRTENFLAADAAVPADAVTSSGSGLDPHISVANANLQLVRVAHARLLAPSDLQKLVETQTEDRDLGIFGEPTVNVLLLNRALDQAAK